MEGEVSSAEVEEGRSLASAAGGGMASASATATAATPATPSGTTSGGLGVHLVMTEFPAKQTAALALRPEQAAACDVAVLLFDPSRPGTLDYLTQVIQPKLPRRLPCVFVAVESEPSPDRREDHREGKGSFEGVRAGVEHCTAFNLNAN